MDYQVSINEFEGPLDLLLHLVKEMKMDIYEIKTEVIIDGYLDYIHGLQDLNIDIASEFLVMASDLIHLKSKMLIGKTFDEEQEESEYGIQNEEDLKTRLIEYQKYKEVTKSFLELEEKRSNVFTKVPESLKEYVDTPVLINNGITVEDLLEAFLNLQERIHYKEPVNTKITKKEISIDSRRNRIRKILGDKKKITFDELFEVWNKEYVVVTFLALLDMMKSGEIQVSQEENFSQIWIESKGMEV